MRFSYLLCICALAIIFLLSTLNLILDLSFLIFTCFHLNSICAGVSEAIKRVLSQFGIGVALKPHCMLPSVFPKPKDRIGV